MLKILGIILGFFILILTVIGLVAEDEYVYEGPVDQYGPVEDYVFEDPADQYGPVEVFEWEEDVLPGTIADDGAGGYRAGSLSAGDGRDVLEETPQQLFAGIGAMTAAQEPDTLDTMDALDIPVSSVTFGDGYSMQIPEGLILADGGDADDYEIMGFSEGQGPAFSIRCMIPDPALTMEDLEAICEDLYGEAEAVTREGPTYLTAYDDATDTQMCIFPSEFSSQIYIISMTGLSDEQPAQWYFDTIQ